MKTVKLTAEEIRWLDLVLQSETEALDRCIGEELANNNKRLAKSYQKEQKICNTIWRKI